MDLKRLPKTEFASAIAQIAGERNLDAQLILDSIVAGLISAYKRDQKEHGITVSEESLFDVELEAESGSFKVYDITNPDKKIDVTPPGFGRIAAQTAKQVLEQKLSEAERDQILSEYDHKVGSLVSGTVVRIDPYKMVVSLNKAEGLMLKDDQIRGENLTLGSKKLFLVLRLSENSTTGKREILLSRRDPDFIKQLFVREIPEVGNKSVKIEKIARAAGDRTKVAVSSAQTGVDPVGSCIGQKGSRISAILNEIPSSEKVDVILYAKKLEQFIVNALSPATKCELKEFNKEHNTAIVEVAEEQLAQAIGSNGDNVRLAGELVGGIEIKVVASPVKSE